MLRFWMMLIALWVAAAAEPISVVTSAQSPLERLSLRQIQDLFLGKRQYIDAYRVVPVNLLAENPLRKSFEQNVLGMNREVLNAYWVRQHFQGVAPPLTQSSVAALMKFIGNVEGSICYIPSSMVGEQVKVLYEF